MDKITTQRLSFHILLVIGLLCLIAAPAQAATFTVNSAGDEGDSFQGDGICDTANDPIESPPIPPSGFCTLRAAIQQANDNRLDLDVITFTVQTVAPRSALPSISSPVLIDGTSVGGDGTSVPGVELNGSFAGLGDGLIISGTGNVTLRGLVITRFSGDGVLLLEGGNVVKGCLISANGTDGIGLLGSDGNRVQGNLILDNGAGGASGSGVHIFVGSNNVIGGPTPEARNVISGNLSDGVTISGSELSGGTNNIIQGNYIGTDVTGKAALGNIRFGVFISGARDTTLGGTTVGEGNTIAFNRREGVRVSVNVATGNAVLGNSIFSNGELGIDLEPVGLTPNDLGDADTGPNNLQNFPALALAADGRTVDGNLNSTPDTPFRLEFFSNTSCDSSGHGEGEHFVDSMEVTTDGSGNAPFTSPAYQFTTATATGTTNRNTSEFSVCVADVCSECPDGSTRDTDGDGLLDCWETGGIGPHPDGTFDLNLKALGADPNHKDLFVEVDWMALHQPLPESLGKVISSFDNAPLQNPDGTRGVKLHIQIDDEEAVGHNDNLTFPLKCTGSAVVGIPDFDDVKKQHFGTKAERDSPNKENILNAKRCVFRYALFAHNLLGRGTTSGCAEAANDFVVSLGSWTSIGGHPRGNFEEQAGTFMHEWS